MTHIIGRAGSASLEDYLYRLRKKKDGDRLIESLKQRAIRESGLEPRYVQAIMRGFEMGLGIPQEKVDIVYRAFGYGVPEEPDPDPDVAENRDDVTLGDEDVYPEHGDD